jgi:NADH:ubiquinone oxidoreductase subunit F (NADH-binding)/(2Fe-2S) ferredoxin
MDSKINIRDIVFNRYESSAIRYVDGKDNNGFVVYLGVGTCSILAGVNETLCAVRSFSESYNSPISIIETACRGMCTFDPLMEVQIPGRNRIVFKNVKATHVLEILTAIFNQIVPSHDFVLGQYSQPSAYAWPGVGYIEDIPFYKKQKRLLTAHLGEENPTSINSYLANGGFVALGKVINQLRPVEVCSIVTESGLQGRGGGGFSTGVKWETTRENESTKKYFICNADESDPGSFVDRMLIEGNPFALIEGVIIGAYAIRASEAIIYINNRYSLPIERLKQALNIVVESGLIGSDINGSGYSLNIDIIESPGAYVCGEETALIASIEGLRGMPNPKPPYPATHGLFGVPTVVNNVETLCNIPLILQHGAEWFRSLGNSYSSGTKVFSVTGKSTITGLVEMTMGSTVIDIIEACDGLKIGQTAKAVHIGGPSGGFIPPSHFSVPLDYFHLQQENLWPGSGSFTVIDDSNCIVDLCLYYMQYIENESCGKCIPCREGSQRMVEILQRITHKPVSANNKETLVRFKGIMQIEHLAEVMQSTSLCGLGQRAPNLVRSALKYFKHEFEEHIYERKCISGVCRHLRSFSIDVDTCNGCTLCARKCPADAVIGTQKHPHFIVEEKCINCGVCYDVCKFNAIIIT